MASSTTTEIEAVESRTARWRRQVMLGPLPPDFLRITTPQDVQQAADHHAAMALYQQQIMTQYVAPNHIGRLSITCAQAKLARNYGLTRMDPYVRIRVGHYVYETQTDPNGGKNPRWNRVIQCQLPSGVKSIYVEIYDECSFKMDELIAWCEIKIPDSVMQGETHEEWYPLSGKQGEGLEGTIDIVLTFSNQPIQQQPYIYQALPTVGGPVYVMPGARPMPVFVSPQQQVAVQSAVQQPPPVLSEADFKQIHEMFPNIEQEVIKSVFEANRGNKDATINSLLQLTE